MRIPYGRQTISEEDIQAVVSVLKSDYLTQGPEVPNFEAALSTYCNSSYAVAVNSATSALHIACIALEIGSGDIVWTTPITFVATANSILYCGAKIDFVDIDPGDNNISIKSLHEKLIFSAASNALPKAVIVVHLSGNPCDMQRIHKLSLEYGFRIIEDASHALGACYDGYKVGSCTHSDITVFSFHPVKIITTGEGGAALTNSPELKRRMQLLRSHGISADAAEMDSRPEGEIWNYQQLALGFNYRMSDISAALGLSQMNNLEDFIDRRVELANGYHEAFKDLPIDLPVVAEGSRSSYHLFIIRLREGNKKTHKLIYKFLLEKSILVNLHYIPVYRHPYYHQLGFNAGYCKTAEEYFSSAISLPIYPSMTNEQQLYVIEAVREAILNYAFA